MIRFLYQSAARLIRSKQVWELSPEACAKHIRCGESEHGKLGQDKCWDNSPAPEIQMRKSGNIVDVDDSDRAAVLRLLYFLFFAAEIASDACCLSCSPMQDDRRGPLQYEYAARKHAN